MPHKINDRNLAILQTVLKLGCPDREQITASLSRPGFGNHGVEKALSRMAREGYLLTDLKAAVSERAKTGTGRARVIYLLGSKGRAALNLSSRQLSQVREARYDLGANLSTLAHDSLAAWTHALLLAGVTRGYWTGYGEPATKLAFPAAGLKKRTPDKILNFKTGTQRYRRFVEVERENHPWKTISHAEWYWQAHMDRHIDGRVLFVCENEKKLEAIRFLIMDRLENNFQNAADSSFFLFLSRDQVDMEAGFKPLGTAKFKIQDLMKPVLLTAGDKLAPLVPGLSKA